MDALRRLVQPATAQRAERRVRRINPDAARAPRLRRKERALSAALDQLREGVPLNWGQVEDDPELLTLARLQGAAQECRLENIIEPPRAKRAALVEHLAKRIPAPKPLKPAKVAPTSLAGFSEKVQVLTQVEEKVSVRTDVPKLLARVAITVVVVGLLAYGIPWFIKTFTTPNFSWIELQKGGDIVNRVSRTKEWLQYPCKVQRESDQLESEPFHTYPSMRSVRDKLTFDVPMLPLNVTTPTATISFVQASVASCQAEKQESHDPGAMLKLDYTATYKTLSPGATATTLEKITGGKEVTVPLVVYVASQQPIPVDAQDGSWHEVRLIPATTGPDLHGVVWQGDFFHDRSGVAFYGPVIVLLVERGDLIMMIEGGINDGITEEFLLEIARHVAW